MGGSQRANRPLSRVGSKNCRRSCSALSSKAQASAHIRFRGSRVTPQTSTSYASMVLPSGTPPGNDGRQQTRKTKGSARRLKERYILVRGSDCARDVERITGITGQDES